MSCIITAGRPGNGKSTALNNIFDLESGVSTVSVTGTIHTTDIIKDEIHLKVIDTPGFGDLRISTQDKIRDMEKVLQKQGEYTLLYCIDVRPVNPFPLKDVDTMKALQDVLGMNVWQKCVILFTFSDTATEKDFDDEAESYEKHLKEYSGAFQEALKSCGVKKNPIIKVTTIFECEGTTMENRKCRVYDRKEKEGELSAKAVGGASEEEIGLKVLGKPIEELIAIPVGATRRVKENILPNVIPNGSDWTRLVFLELMRKTERNKLMNFISFKFGNARGAQFASDASIPKLGQFMQELQAAE